MCDYYVEILCVGRIESGWAHDVFIVACHMFMHFSCIRTILFFLTDMNYVWYSFCFSLSLSLFIWLVYSWYLKRASLLCPRTLFDPGHHLLPLLILPPLMLGSVMIKPVRTLWRTFLDAAFIRNAKSSCWLGVPLWHPHHLSLCGYTGVLLQYARIWLLCTSFHHLRLRYMHCSHFGSYI